MRSVCTIASAAAGRSAWIPAPTAAIIAAPSTGASLTRVNEIGTFETSACSCIHRSLAAGPPDTTWCVGSKPCSRSVRRMSSVP